jgi:hypothetical protein
MVLTEFFDDFSSISTSRWTAATAGNGTVTASDSNAVLDEGGTANGDVAALILDEVLDFTADWVFAVCLKVTGATTTAHSPNLVGIYDSADTIPSVGTQAAQNTAHRIFVENQMNITTAANSRFQYRFKNPSATVYTWRNATDDWSTSFEHSHSQANTRTAKPTTTITSSSTSTTRSAAASGWWGTATTTG